MKLCVVTIYDENYYEIANVTIPSDKEYCLKNGYDFIAHKLLDGNYHYKKHELFCDLLERYDVIFYKDIDSIFTNHTIKIENFLSVKDVYFTKDINEINGGVFMVKSSLWVKMWNDFVLSQKQLFPNEQNVYNHYEVLFSSNIEIYPQYYFNSYKYEFYGERFGKISGDAPKNIPSHENGQWNKGDFILHVPALTLITRINILEEVKNHIIK